MKISPYNRYHVVVEHMRNQKTWYRTYTVPFTQPAQLKALMSDTFANPTATELRIRRGVRIAVYCRIATIDGKPPRRHDPKWERFPDRIFPH